MACSLIKLIIASLLHGVLILAFFFARFHTNRLTTANQLLLVSRFEIIFKINPKLSATSKINISDDTCPEEQRLHKSVIVWYVCVDVVAIKNMLNHGMLLMFVSTIDSIARKVGWPQQGIE